MSDQPEAPGWEQGSDGKWYAPAVLGAAGDGRWHEPQQPSGESQDPLAEPRPAGPAPKGLAAWWRASSWLTRGLAIAVPVLLIAVIGAFAARVSTQSNADALEADLGQSRSDIAAAEARIADLEAQSEGTAGSNADQADGYERLLDEARATLDELESSPTTTTTAAPPTTMAPPTTAAPEEPLVDQVIQAALGTVACPYELGPGCAIVAGAREENGRLVIETFLTGGPSDQTFAHSLCMSTVLDRDNSDEWVDVEDADGEVIKSGNVRFVGPCGTVESSGPGLFDAQR